MSKRRTEQASAAMPAGEAQSRRSDEALAQLYALAVAQQQSGQAETAIETYRRCLSISSSHPEIYNNLGTVLDQLGRLPEAVECFQCALALDPSYVRPLVNLGRVLRLQGRPYEALAALERAHILSPDSAALLTNLGFVLTDLGRRHEAIRHLRRAINVEPGLAEAHHALGLAMAYSGDTRGARDSLVRAIALKPDLLDAYAPLASSLVLLQELPDALAALDKYLEKRPDDQNALAVALSCSQYMCDWTRVQSTLERMRKLPSETAHAQPFTMMGISDDPAEHLQAASIRAAAIARDHVALPSPVFRRHDKIRVAYVSSDFFTHATSFLITELLELHDRSSFEIYGVDFGPDDGSALRKRVLGTFDTYLEARDRSDLEIATWMREREVDIAVDLKGYTAHARPGIFAHRAAPIQVSYLGYPGTMGAPFMDYIVADAVIIPGAERQHYTEKVIHLPNSYQANDRRRRVSEREPTRTEVGLPESAFVFCCFNNNWKITAPVFEVWTRLLRNVPGSVFWLLEDNRWAAENLRRQAASQGIAPERLVFSGRAGNEDHLARHQLADLFLDTFPYNAHTTASDALWAGLPVVTCSGRTFASRVAGSLLHAVGLPEMIAASLEEYERLALGLAVDREKLQAIRARLENREELPLFDTPIFCRHLEAAYGHMLGVALAQRGSFNEAVPLMRTAAELCPASAMVHLNLGNALSALERYPEALQCYERVTALEPQNGQAQVRRGIALAKLGRLTEAQSSFARGAVLNPQDPDSHYNLGNLYGLQRRHDLAVASFSRALELFPGYSDARFNLALLRLLREEWREGWELYEERFAIDARRGAARRFAVPRWTGKEPVEGRSILLWAERGLGDALQFCRYAPLVRDLGAAVILEVQPRLKALLASQFTGLRVVGTNEHAGVFDYECPLLSLPRAFGTELGTIPGHVPYLGVDGGAVERWAQRLPADGSLRVGIAWQGNINAERNWARGRSIPLCALEPLASHPGVRLISLQTGPGAAQLDGVGFADRILSFGEALDAGLSAFMDTAAIIMGLDLVISSDSAVAHLAGALGVPVWVALHATSEWRWLLDRSDSPWYPSMRLFRQPAPGDWQAVVSELRLALSEFPATRPAPQRSGADSR